MNNQNESSVILVKATAQGFSIAIHGVKQSGGTWKCAVEKNEVTITDIPAYEDATSLGEQREYRKSEFELSFEEAYKEFDDSEWFLCHPGPLHGDVADFIMEKLEKRFAEYDEQYPADSPMEKFIRKNKLNEWRSKAEKSKSG